MAVCEKYEFEARIPVDCLMDVVSVIRSGELMTRKGEVLTHAGAAMGELGAFIHQYETPDVFAAVGEIPTTIEECVEALEELSEDELSSLREVVAGAPAGNAVYWVALALKLLRLLIDELT